LPGASLRTGIDVSAAVKRFIAWDYSFSNRHTVARIVASGQAVKGGAQTRPDRCIWSSAERSRGCTLSVVWDDGLDICRQGWSIGVIFVETRTAAHH
jgi:hypothetical protein